MQQISQTSKGTYRNYTEALCNFSFVCLFLQHHNHDHLQGWPNHWDHHHHLPECQVKSTAASHRLFYCTLSLCIRWIQIGCCCYFAVLLWLNLPLRLRHSMSESDPQAKGENTCVLLYFGGGEIRKTTACMFHRLWACCCSDKFQHLFYTGDFTQSSQLPELQQKWLRRLLPPIRGKIFSDCYKSYHWMTFEFQIYTWH